MIRYAIADDHKIFRQGLRTVLAGDHKLTCTGEAANGMELLALLEREQVDVALVDLKMPEMDGIAVTPRIRERYPATKVLILTMYDDEHFILHLMEAGAHGYLLKNAEPTEIIDAINMAHSTGHYFSDLVSRTLLKKVAQKPSGAPRPDVSLNEREIQVLRLICEECTAVDIGKRMFLSPRTVEGIRSNLMEKTGVANTAGLVIYAMRNGYYS